MQRLLEISLLGRVEILQGGQPLAALSTRKVEALLIYLVCTGRPQQRDLLAELLWPERTQKQARRNLRATLSRLRQVLADYIVTTRHTIAFNQDEPYWLDIVELKQQLTSVRQTPQLTEPQATALAEMLKLYQGDFLAGFQLNDAPDFDAWVTIERERLHQQTVEGLHQLLTYYVDVAEHGRVVALIQRLLAMDQFDEMAHGQMMRALALTGQRSAALTHYERYVQRLSTELGVEPDTEIKTLYERIKSGEVGDREIGYVGFLSQTSLPPCPYRGLSTFTEADAPFFFGREEITPQLIEAVHHQPLVAVIGPSGSGKSSVVYAGLLPHLRQRATEINHSNPQPPNFLIATVRPGRQPFRSLAAALVPLLEPELNETEQLVEIKKLREALVKQRLSFSKVVARILDKEARANRLLLVVDQFEELYTLCQDSHVQQLFVDTLLEDDEQLLAPDYHSSFRLILTLRADFMGKVLSYRPLADALQGVGVIVGPMNRAELRQAIEKPAQKQGVTFEPGLVERILDDVGHEPGNLPLLEFTLTLLWEKQSAHVLSHAGYEAIGRVAGSLTYYADSIYTQLNKSGQASARHIFVQLVHLGIDTEDTRRVAHKDEIGDANWPVVECIAGARLVVVGRDMDGIETVEMVHEALIKNWNRLQSWLKADRAFRAWQERLRVHLGEWNANDSDVGALLHGALLTEAEQWLEHRANDLSEAERRFVERSAILRDKQLQEVEAHHQAEQQWAVAMELSAKRQLRWYKIGLMIALLLALVALVTLTATTQVVWFY